MLVKLFLFLVPHRLYLGTNREMTDEAESLCLTCAGLPRHAVGLSLIVSVLVLETHQVRVGLRAETSSDTDDVLVGSVYHLLHL